MAKKMRRMTALVLALVLLASQLAMPSVAAESGTEPDAQVLTPASVTVDPDTGDTTITVTTTSTDPSTGATTTKTETETTDPNTGAVTKTTSTETEQTDVTNDGAHMETHRTEESKAVTTYPDVNGTAGENDESDVLVEKETKEESQGSSDLVVDTKPVGPSEERTTVTGSGEEESSSVTTTTTTTTTEDVKNEDPIDVDVGDEVPGDVKPISDNTEQKTDWAEGDLTDQTQWVDGTPVEGTDVSDATPGESTTGDKVTLNDSLTNEDDVVINLKPNEKWYQGVVDISTEKLLAGEYGEIFNPDDHEGSQITTVKDKNGNIVKVTVVDTNGTITTIEPSRNSDGVDGWTLTTVSEQHGQRQEGDVKETATEIKDATTSVSVEDKDSEDAVKKGTQETKDDDGNTVKTTVERIEVDGEIKYRTTEDTIKVEETVTTAPIDPALQEQYRDEEKEKEQKGFRPIPQDEIPQAKEETQDDNGTKIKVKTTVEPIVADADSDLVKDGYVTAGTVIGYRSVTTKTSDENKYYHSETKEIYGTAFSVNVTTTTDPQTLETHTITTTTDRKIQDQYFTEHSRPMDVELERTDKYQTTILTEEDIYQLANAEDGSYFEFNGMMGIVTGSVSLENNYSIASGTIAKDANGNWYLASTTVPMEGEDLRPYSTKFPDNYNGQFKWNGTYTGKNGEWVQIGRGQYAGFLTWDESATGSNDIGRHTAQQYMIYNGKEVRFVYCVELNTSAPSGAYYNTNEMGDEESGEAVWFKPDGTPSAGTVDKIRIVAANGYWGTESGVGSLQAVKDLLIRHGYSDVAGRLTEGMAMTGTQLGLWEYGNTSNGKKFVDTYKTDNNGKYILDHNGLKIGNGDYVTWDDAPGTKGAEPTTQDKADIAVVRNLLIALAEGTLEGGKTEQITKDSITGGAIVVKEQVIDKETGEAKKDEQGNIKYNTAVQMKLDISTSSINGDIVLKVYNDKNELAGSYRLAGDDDHSIFDLVTTRIYPDENGVYTLENLELFENRPITLNLDGIQQMDDGIYIYTNKTTQDFVGLATQENRVNLSVTMQFNVEEPEMNHSSSSSTRTRTDSITSTAKAKRTDKAIFVRTVLQEQDLSQVTREQYILSTITKVETLEEKTMEKLRWENYYEYLLTTINGEDGNVNEDPNAADAAGAQLLILDEEVPLAAAPKTGDSTLMWAMITMLALAGAAALSIAPKRKVR